jgi:steroid delta-isomerase
MMRGTLLRPVVAAAAGLLALPVVAVSDPASEHAEQQIRRALADWQHTFNAGDTGSVCNLFAPDLRYDYRGFPERGFADICGLLSASLADRSRKYTYDLLIKEVIVSGDFAAVRLVWTLTVKRQGQSVDTVTAEPGLDLFRRQSDGSWKIVRYIAYEE